MMRRKHDRVDRMTADEARAFMGKEIELQTTGSGNRKQVKMMNHISFGDLRRIKEKADKVE